MNTLNQLKAVLVFIAIFHLVFGFGLMFSIDVQKAAPAIYGGTLGWNTADIYFIRIIGSFAFVLGSLAWIASRDPMRHSRLLEKRLVKFCVLPMHDCHTSAAMLHCR